MPFLDRGDAAIFYDVAGSGPALIFAHGLGGNHLSWWQQVPHFRERYTCVTFAHRGFAPSPETAGGPGPDAFVDDLAALIAHLGLDDVRLVGQSMGGWTCLGYALRHPARVRALVLACTTGVLTHPTLDAIFLRHGGQEVSLFARGIHPAVGERMAREQPALHHLYRAIDGLSHNLDKQSVRAKLWALRTASVAEIAMLSVPTLCITGEEDIVIAPEAVAFLAQHLPNAQLVRVPEAGHSVYFERPQEFNRLVDEFLGRNERE
jgi:3-oxoadipate enol-lactonase